MTVCSPVQQAGFVLVAEKGFKLLVFDFMECSSFSARSGSKPFIPETCSNTDDQNKMKNKVLMNNIERISNKSIV
jgi:hypothetical protein